MISLTAESLAELLKLAGIKPRVRNDLRFAKSTESIGERWNDSELAAITDKTGNKGVLLIQPYEELYAVQYELLPRITDSFTGRSRAIICDFCYTWQAGSNAAGITFMHTNKKGSVSFLCCADLACSDHVRTLTKASLVSRSQLRENLTNDERVERLKKRLQDKIEQLELRSLTL